MPDGEAVTPGGETVTPGGETVTPGGETVTRPGELGRCGSKADEVAAALRELIVRGDIAPGAPLRQRHLAERFGVSPTPVREALRRLESEGLVHNDVNRGSTVAKLDPKTVEESYQIRAELEGLAVRLAASKLTATDLRDARAIHLELGASRDLDPRRHGLNRRFHFRIYECAGSPLLMSMLRLLWRSFPGGPRVSRPHQESTAQHAAILDALEAGDADLAAARTRDHILRALPYVVR
ncbi:MAG TPA: GntR family transcriptional regulator [Actinomycetes bacterium]|nr:GntR family transcriptional regulator [Actinomycetes bacterium]